jgi:hypothetical protein
MIPPCSEKQLAKLWAEAHERNWHRDQVYGRAGEINQAALDKTRGLHALNMREMSRLIGAVMTEQPWIDPRQLRFDVAN